MTSPDNQDEIAFLASEVSRLDEILEETNNKRAKILRQINSIRSPIRVLPPETLATIFQYAIPFVPINTKPTDESNLKRKFLVAPTLPFTLGSVSHYWREVAWTTPRLWTALRTWIIEDQIDDTANLMRLFFRNASSLPISLRMSFQRGYNTQTSLAPLEQFLFQEKAIGRVKVLAIERPVSWLQLMHSATLPQLVQLAIDFRPGPSEFGPLTLRENTPILREVEFAAPPPLDMHWLDITSLSLSAMTIVSMIEILLQCPNLVDFEMGAVYMGTSTAPPTTLPLQITFPHMKKLTWSYNPDEWADVILERLHLPALQRLSWKNNGYEVDDIDEASAKPLLVFFGNLSSSPITTLELIDVEFGTPLMKHLYRSVPHLTTLKLDEYDQEPLRRSLNILLPGSSRNAPEDSYFLPNLRRIEINLNRDNYTPLIMPNSFGNELHFLVLLRSRCPGIQQDGLVVDLRVSIEWPAAAKRNLHSLVEDGYNLKVLENGKPVDWL